MEGRKSMQELPSYRNRNTSDNESEEEIKPYRNTKKPPVPQRKTRQQATNEKKGNHEAKPKPPARKIRSPVDFDTDLIKDNQSVTDSTVPVRRDTRKNKKEDESYVSDNTSVNTAAKVEQQIRQRMGEDLEPDNAS